MQTMALPFTSCMDLKILKSLRLNSFAGEMGLFLQPHKPQRRSSELTHAEAFTLVTVHMDVSLTGVVAISPP